MKIQYENFFTKEHIKYILDILSPSMDDYIYLYDLINDYYCISPSALDRFCLPSSEFTDVVAMHQLFVHPADIDLLSEELNSLISQEKTDHNLIYRWLDHDKNPVWINCRGKVLVNEEGQSAYLMGCINEIGKKQKADNVSGLLGEASFMQEIKEWEGMRRTEGYFMCIGIDYFKEINENRGRDYGDMILRRTAQCISKHLTEDQKLYRVIGDEFIVIDYSAKDAQDAQLLYRKIRNEIDQFLEENYYEVFYTLSAGILELANVVTQTYENLWKLVEFSLSEAKNRGKNQYYIYNKEDYAKFLRKRKLIRVMRRAVSHGFEGFETYYQPLIDVQSGVQLVGAETLLRFHDRDEGNISPMEFIPILEESGLIIPVGRWVLHEAMRHCLEIQNRVPDFKVSVNLSYIQVLKSDVFTEIVSGFNEMGLKPGSLMIELTESGFLESDATMVKFCKRLNNQGIGLALDDFGTGYSNFHYLSHLALDTIKIDRSFTMQAIQNEHEFILLSHMADMVHSLHMKLCIEGIETKEELQKISQIHPEYIQGYYFGKPLAFDEFMKAYVINGIQKEE